MTADGPAGRHLYNRGKDCTALKLTGASSEQIDVIFSHTNSWEATTDRRRRRRLSWGTARMAVCVGFSDGGSVRVPN